MTENRPLLTVNGLESGYGKQRILKEISFCLNSGEVLALIGPNGSGKTTLLRAVAGLRPASGRITAEETQDFSKKKPEERARWIGYLSSAPVIPPDMTAAELTEKGFHPEFGLLGNVTEEQKRRARDCLERLGLLWTADRPMRTLSGGQQQLVLLARAVVRNPRILILDEPDAALDFKVAREIAVYLRNLAKETGCGVLMTSHDVNLMLRYADRILMLKDGRLVADESPDTESPERLEAGLKELYGPVELICRGECRMMTEVL